MLARRGFRYRIYPTPEQAARLRQWEGALRVLWNLAHEQRLAALLERPRRDRHRLSLARAARNGRGGGADAIAGQGHRERGPFAFFAFYFNLATARF